MGVLTGAVQHTRTAVICQNSDTIHASGTKCRCRTNGQFANYVGYTTISRFFWGKSTSFNFKMTRVKALLSSSGDIVLMYRQIPTIKIKTDLRKPVRRINISRLMLKWPSLKANGY